MKTIYMSETKDHVRSLLSQESLKHDWVALGPEAAYEMEKNSINHFSYSQFLSRKDMSDICEKWHDRVRGICTDLDLIFSEHNPDIDKNIKPFLFSIFPLTILFDSLVSRICYLKRIIEKTGTKRIVINRSAELSFGAFDITFSNSDYIWSKLLEQGIWPVEVSFEASQEIPASKRFDLKGCLKNIIISIKDMAKPKGPGLMYYEPLYEWLEMKPVLTAAGYDLFKYRGCRKSVAQLKKNPHVREYYINGKDHFDCLGTDIFDLIEDRLDWIWDVSSKTSDTVIKDIGRLARSRNIKAVLASSGGDLFSGIVNSAARINKIPVIKWQHGFIYSNKKISQLADYKDLLTTDHVLAFGRGSKNAYGASPVEHRSKIHLTGSASLDNFVIGQRPAKRKPHDKKTILYVTTNYYQSNWYCGFYPPFDDMLFYEDQKQIISGLMDINTRTGSPIVVKLHPSHYYSDPPWAEKAEASGAKIIKDNPGFVQVLSDCDAVVIDAPTTTLLQTICTEKPVFILSRHIPYTEEMNRILLKRAVISENSKILMSKVSDYIENDIYPANTKDTEFLKEYGTYLNDGKSCNRALDILEEVVNNA